MNDIEEEARPHLARMIRGERCLLGPDAQAAVATWATKTSVVARCAHLTPDPVERTWTDWLHSQRSAIPGWRVWTATYVGTEPLWYDGRDISFQMVPIGPKLANHGLLATLAIGYLVLQVIGVEGAVLLAEPSDTDALRIFPSTTALQYWPPRFHLDDTSLPLFARRLLGDLRSVVGLNT
jgi:hypothetical protein